jgi:hypothetical protein
MAVKKITRKRRPRRQPEPLYLMRRNPFEHVPIKGAPQMGDDFTPNPWDEYQKFIPVELPPPKRRPKLKHNPQPPGRSPDYPIERYQTIARGLAADAKKRGKIIDDTLSGFAERVELEAEREGLRIPKRPKKSRSSRQMQRYVAGIYWNAKE